jgi:hypothetical protein
MANLIIFLLNWYKLGHRCGLILLKTWARGDPREKTSKIGLKESKAQYENNILVNKKYR